MNRKCYLVMNNKSKIYMFITFYKFYATGRVITAEYEDYFVVTCYTPNSKSELERLDIEWCGRMRLELTF